MPMVNPVMREQTGPSSLYGSGPPMMSGWQAQAPADEDLPTIEQRCRLKAEASRWAGQRQRLLKDGADFHTEIEPKDRDIIGRAKALPECFLWMNHKDGPIPRDLSIYDDMSGAFDTTAYALTVLRAMLKETHKDRDVFEQVLQLTAEAQSCVRGAVIAMEGKPDRDQMKIFYWLRGAGAEYQILIRRFMRQDDIADFRAWPDVRRRMEEVETRIQSGKNHEKHQRLLVNKIRHLTRKLVDEKSDDDWAELIQAIDELVAGGVQPSNKELRDLLLPIIEDLPDLPSMPEYPKSFGLVLREIDRYRTTVGEEEELVEDEVTTSAEVKKVAELLKGKALVLIGGDRRHAAADSIMKAFGLTDLIWIETREHQTHSVFEPHVARDDVAAVILAIRWSSHGFGEVKDFCDRYDKPLVRLPAGYSPNQLAHHIIGQIAGRLAVER